MNSTNIISNLQNYIIDIDGKMSVNNILINNMIIFIKELFDNKIDVKTINIIIPIKFKTDLQLIVAPFFDEIRYNLVTSINNSDEDLETKEDLIDEINEVIQNCFDEIVKIKLATINDNKKNREIENNINLQLNELYEIIKQIIPNLNKHIIDEFTLW